LAPLVDGKVVVTRDSDDGGNRHGRVGVGGNVSHGGVGQELHDHAHIVLDCREHHWRLNNIRHITDRITFSQPSATATHHKHIQVR